jgi:HSP20 family molecular chaperone IbpA
MKEDGILLVRAGAGRTTFERLIPLPTPVDDATATESFANGVLELRLWKR